MNCRAVHDHLNLRLDGSAGGLPAAAAEHLRDCPACTALHAAAERLIEGLHLLAPPMPPEGLGDRIAARVGRVRRYRPRIRGRRRRAVVPLAVAACLLLAIGARFWLAQRPGQSAPAGSSPEIAHRVENSAVPQGLRNSVAEAREAVAALTSRTAGAAVDHTRWLLPNMLGSAVPRPEKIFEPPTRTLREAGAGVSAGLAPVTDSALRAVDLFRRDLPPMDLGENRGL
jgi:hypothetical protein